MPVSPEVRQALIERYAGREGPLDRDVLGRIVDEIAEAVAPTATAPPAPASPFDLSWMDSFLAHWTLGRTVAPTDDRFDEVAGMLRDAMDVRFRERMAEIGRFVERPGALAPDGGPPEPGTPPVGPAALRRPGERAWAAGVDVVEPPDGGTPEPGAPTPVGPLAALPTENPWILYWFVSVKAPMLLDVLDAHLDRRLEEWGIEPG